MATTTLSAENVEATVDQDTTTVEAFEPDAMMSLADSDTPRAVAADAKRRLNAALAALDSGEGAH